MTDTFTPDGTETRHGSAPALHRRMLTDRPILLSFPERADRPAPCRFATFVRDRREHLGLSIGEVARQTGLSHRTIRDLEISQIPAVKLSTIVLLHRVLDVPAESLMLLALDGTLPRTDAPRTLRAVPDYGKPGSWLVWMPGEELRCERTTATSCTCAQFAAERACECQELVIELERTQGNEVAA